MSDNEPSPQPRSVEHGILSALVSWPCDLCSPLVSFEKVAGSAFEASEFDDASTSHCRASVAVIANVGFKGIQACNISYNLPSAMAFIPAAIPAPAGSRGCYPVSGLGFK